MPILGLPRPPLRADNIVGILMLCDVKYDQDRALIDEVRRLHEAVHSGPEVTPPGTSSVEDGGIDWNRSRFLRNLAVSLILVSLTFAVFVLVNIALR